MSKKILIVDAVNEDRQAIVELLDGAGYETEQGADAAAALSLAKDGIALIILAVELPDQNGFVVCTKLKKKAQTVNIPLFITSAKASQQDYENHLQLSTHADGYFMKPLDYEVLLEEIKAVIGDEAATETAAQDAEILFEQPHESAAQSKEIEMIEVHDELLTLEDSGSLLKDLGLDSLDIYDAMGTVEVGDAMAERLPSLTLEEVRENSGLLTNPVKESAPDSHTKEIPKEELDAAQELSAKSSKSASTPSISSVKLPPLPPKFAAAPSNKEVDQLKSELEKLKVIESTQQKTIERQLDEISQLQATLAQAQKNQPASDAELVEQLREENARLSAENKQLSEKLDSFGEIIRRIKEITQTIS